MITVHGPLRIVMPFVSPDKGRLIYDIHHHDHGPTPQKQFPCFAKIAMYRQYTAKKDEP